ncbi:MAG: PAS domain-containing protein, partial [Candidatus Thorarchaeota archaeon]
MWDFQTNNIKELFKSIYDYSPIGIGIYDLDGKMIDLNQSCMELFGVLNKNEIIGFDLLNNLNIPKENLDKLKKRIRISHELIFDFDLIKEQKLFKTTKSGKIYINVLITPLFLGESNSFINYLVYIQDISDRKITEQKLKDSEERFKDLYNNAQVAMFSVTLDGKPIAINNLGLSMLGYPSKHDFFSNFNSNNHLANPNDMQKLMEKLKQNDEIHNFQIQSLTTKGDQFWSELSIKLYPKKRQIDAVAVDITKIKKIEQLLKNTKLKVKEENENLFNVLNSIGRGVYIVNSQYDVEFINPELKRELGPLNGKKCYGYFLNRSNPCPDCKLISVFKGKTIKQEFFSSKVNKIFEVTSTPLINLDGSVSKLGIFYDITKYKKVENSLKQKEISYKKLTENLPCLVYRVLVKENNKMIFFNDLLESLTGYKEEDISYGEVCSIDPLIHSEDREKIISVVKKAVKNYLVFNIEYRFIHKNGEIRWFSEIGSPIYEESGDLFSIDGVIFDITERKIAEEKLKASERRFIGILKNASHGIALIKPNGRFITFNKKAATMLGYTTEEFINETLLGITHPDDLKKSQERLKMLLDGDLSSYRIEKRYLTKNGKEFWVDISVRALYDDNGAINAILGILVDINERKKAEMKLKKSEDMYRNLLSNIMDIIVEIDLNGFFLYISPQVYNILGYNPEEVIGVNGFNLIHLDDLKRVKLIIRDAVKGKDHIYLEFRILHKKGNYIDVSAHGKVACVDGVDKVFLVIRDISARKLAVKSARESQQLLENTFNALNDAVFVLNTENPPIILRCNLTAEKIFGYSVKEMLKKPTSFLHIDKKSLEEFQQVLYPKIKRGEVFTNFKYKMKRKDGTVFPSEHSVIPLENEKGKRIGWVSVVRDLTKQMETEQKLKESQEKYRHLFDNSPLGIG